MTPEITENIITWSNISIPIISIGILIIAFLYKENKKLKDDSLKGVVGLLNELKDKMDTLVTKDYLKNEIELARLKMEHKYDLFVVKAKGEVRIAKNALNTANREVRTAKDKVRITGDLVLHALNGIIDNKDTMKAFNKRVKIEAEDFIKDHEGIE